jgi:hypothetical protein
LEELARLQGKRRKMEDLRDKVSEKLENYETSQILGKLFVKYKLAMF